MKCKYLICLIIIFKILYLFPDSGITRGSEIGEIYFVGPVVSDDYGIYYSTDFGETVTCKDSIVNASAITADLTPGGLYYVTMYGELYYSEDYGQQGSWIFRNNGLHEHIVSGCQEGVIYNAINSHSEDYGVNFIPHQYNGFFGNLRDIAINNNLDVCYAVIEDSFIPDSLYFMISYDNFENIEVQHIFNVNPIYTRITRGTEDGEIYLYTENSYIDMKELRYSNDYGETWELKNIFTCPNLPIISIAGGRQPGELYMLVRFVQSMNLIKHVYIYHSTDYGETFDVYHPISIGPEPFYADFEASPTTGSVPLTVQFTDLSGGDPNWILGWEWDFDDDGEIDSYEQHPEYTYQDTGYYSVRLRIYGSGGMGCEDTAYRKDYIHVTTGSAAQNNVVQRSVFKLSNFPNPFNPSTTISFETTNLHELSQIEIYNLKGQKVKTLPVTLSGFEESGFNKINVPRPSTQLRMTQTGNKSYSVTWNGTNDNNQPVSSGIYLYKMNIPNSPRKKMILIK